MPHMQTHVLSTRTLSPAQLFSSVSACSPSVSYLGTHSRQESDKTPRAALPTPSTRSVVKSLSAPRPLRVSPRFDLYGCFKALPVCDGEAHGVEVRAIVQRLYEAWHACSVAPNILAFDRHRRGRILQRILQ